MAAEKDIAEQTAGIEAGIEGIPLYTAPEEASELEALLQAGAGRVRETSQEAVDIARQQTGLAEAPGTGLARQDIRQAQAQSARNIMELGGGGAGSLAAIAQTQRGTQESLRDLSARNLAFRSQATQGLQQALMGQAGIEQAATGMEAQAGQMMLGERGKEYQSEFEKYLTGVQFDISQLGAARQAEEARRLRNAQIWGSVIGAGAQIGGALLTGGASLGLGAAGGLGGAAGAGGLGAAGAGAAAAGGAAGIPGALGGALVGISR
jgi:hypothetical protein